MAIAVLAVLLVVSIICIIVLLIFVCKLKIQHQAPDKKTGKLRVEQSIF